MPKVIFSYGNNCQPFLVAKRGDVVQGVPYVPYRDFAAKQQSWKKPFRKAKALEFEAEYDTLTQAAWSVVLSTTANEPIRLRN